MNVAARNRGVVSPTVRRSGMLRKIPMGAKLTGDQLCGLRIDKLRIALRENRVSFPAQVPLFAKHDRPDLQRKLVQSCTS